jgi:predicted nucleic acid-binding protein
MTYLADTNILLRFLNRADPDYTATRAAVRILKARGDEVVTAAQNMAEFWNVLTRPATVFP